MSTWTKVQILSDIRGRVYKYIAKSNEPPPRGVQSLNKYVKEGGYLSNLYQQETNVLISH